MEVGLFSMGSRVSIGIYASYLLGIEKFFENFDKVFVLCQYLYCMMLQCSK